MHLFFSVGEPSGDQHAAGLIRELQSRLPRLEVSGFGGPLMEKAGLRSHFRLTDLAVMGLLRVLPMLGQFFKLLRQADRVLRAERPDAVILVDFPGFNWWIAHKAKRLGIPVFYYLPPQLWAWAPWRIKRIQRNVDHVLCGLSFEQSWYQQRGVAAEYVGHPFFDEVAEYPLNESQLTQWRNEGQRIVGLLPGSRNQEVELNWRVILSVVRQLAERHPDVHFLAACFRESHREQCQAMLDSQGGDLPIEFCVGKTPEVIEASDCCLMVSGSVSLEMLARRTPAVVMYYGNWLPRLFVRLFVTCKFCSLPNLMLDRELLPEIFPRGDGSEAAGQISSTLSSWLDDEAQLSDVRRQMEELLHSVGHIGATSRAADAIVRHLPGQVAIERAA